MLLAASGVWLGGLQTVPLLASTTARLFAPDVRSRLFVAFGRRFAVLMAVALAVAMVAAAMVVRSSDATRGVGAAVLVGALLVTTTIGVMQARRMSRLRLAVGAGDELAAKELRRNAGVATALRSLIGLLSVALLVVAVLMVSER